RRLRPPPSFRAGKPHPNECVACIRRPWRLGVGLPGGALMSLTKPVFVSSLAIAALLAWPAGAQAPAETAAEAVIEAAPGPAGMTEAETGTSAVVAPDSTDPSADRAATAGQQTTVSHGVSAFGDLKYPPDF